MMRRASKKRAKSKSKLVGAVDIVRNLFVASQLFQVFLCLAIGLLQFQGSDGSPGEAKLRETLFRQYNKLPLPVKNASERLDIMFDLYLQQLIDVDERNQVMTAKVWINHQWVDHRLHWDEYEYDGVSSIIVPTSLIWIPDILIYNNAYGPFDVRYASNATINSNGTVHWLVPSVYKSACKVEVRFYPFDEQRCVLKFGSWTYNGHAIDLIPSYPNETKFDFWPNDEWEVELLHGERNEKYYICCQEPYIDVTFTFILQRKPLFYVAYLLLPCGLISFNTILVFFLPADCSEKMQLCTCILLSMAVFLLLISQQIPPNANNLPLIMKYLLFTKIIVTSSIVLTTLILNMRFRTNETHELSNWQRKLFLDIIPKYLKMRRPEEFNDRFNHSASSEVRKDSIKLLTSRVANMLAPMMVAESGPDDEAEARAEIEGLLNKRSSMGHSSMEPEVSVSANAYTSIKHAVDDVVYITSQYAFAEETCKAKEEWKYCAMVLDRIFLIIYLCGVFIGTIVIIMEAPLATAFFVDLFGSAVEGDVVQPTPKAA